MYSPSHNWEFQYNINIAKSTAGRKAGKKEGRKEASTGHRQTKKQEELNEPKKNQIK